MKTSQKITAGTNKVLPKAGLNGFDWTFVQGSTFVLRLNFCAKNPRLRQYPKRKALQLTGEAIIPALQKPSGFGLSLKRLYGVTKNGLLTFTGGFSKYNLKNDDGAKEVKVSLVPFMVGYKQNIQWDLLMFDC